MRNSILFYLLFSAFLSAQQVDFPKLTGPYLGQKPPNLNVEVFAPGVVSTPEAMEYGMAFSPDGKEFYSSWGGVGHLMFNGPRLFMNHFPVKVN